MNRSKVTFWAKELIVVTVMPAVRVLGHLQQPVIHQHLTMSHWITTTPAVWPLHTCLLPTPSYCNSCLISSHCLSPPPPPQQLTSRLLTPPTLSQQQLSDLFTPVYPPPPQHCNNCLNSSHLLNPHPTPQQQLICSHLLTPSPLPWQQLFDLFTPAYPWPPHPTPWQQLSDLFTPAYPWPHPTATVVWSLHTCLPLTSPPSPPPQEQLSDLFTPAYPWPHPTATVVWSLHTCLPLTPPHSNSCLISSHLLTPDPTPQQQLSDLFTPAYPWPHPTATAVWSLHTCLHSSPVKTQEQHFLLSFRHLVMASLQSPLCWVAEVGLYSYHLNKFTVPNHYQGEIITLCLHNSLCHIYSQPWPTFAPTLLSARLHEGG